MSAATMERIRIAYGRSLTDLQISQLVKDYPWILKDLEDCE